MEDVLEAYSRKYIIFSVNELPKIDFSVICETSQYTVRKSIDKTKTFIKWETESDPWFLDMIETKEGPYTYEEMMDILSSSEWTSSILQ